MTTGLCVVDHDGKQLGHSRGGRRRYPIRPSDIAANLTNDGYDFVSSTVVPLCGGGAVDLAGDGNGPDPDPTKAKPLREELDSQLLFAVDVDR